MFRHLAGCLAFVFIYAHANAQCPITVSAGPDIVRCTSPASVQLSGNITGNYLGFTWSPTTGMTGSTTLNPTVNVSQTTNYILTATALDASTNLIVNGDFEQGVTGFTNDYILSPGNLYPEGVYDVLTNPNAAHPDFPNCGDHTSGSSNMLAVNGAGTPGVDVWCQTVSVTPNTQYVFTAWATSLVSSSPARLQFSINGSTLGTIFNVSSQTCTWQNFYAVWNSGASTTANICIVNQNTAQSGNDFAVDDIVFSPTCRVSDTVRVEVVNVRAMAPMPNVFLPCVGGSVTLSGAGSTVGPGVTYQWQTSDGNIVSGENTLSPVVNSTGSYVLTVRFVTAGGVVCEQSTTVNVLYPSNPLTAIILSPPQLSCALPTITLVGNATPSLANLIYQWSVVTTGNIVGSTTNKNAFVNQPGTYELMITNTITGCTSTAQTTVTSQTGLVVAQASSDTINCVQSTAVLSGAGSSTGAGMVYLWTTPNGTIVSGQTSQHAEAGTPGTYILRVTNTTNGCIARDTVVVTANTTLPYAAINPPESIDCDSDTIRLFVNLSPPPFVLLIWTAEDGGHIASGQYTPSPEITAPGTYILQTTDPINGCISIDTVPVVSNFAYPTAASMPADTLSCQQTSVVLSGAGSSEGFNFGYNWTASGTGNIVDSAQTLSPEVNAPGLYTLTVLNYLNGCTDTATVFVAADTTAVTAIASVDDTLSCSVLSAPIHATSPTSPTVLSYLWTTANGNIVAGADTPDPVVSAPGLYTLTLTNTANGCSATDIVQVIQDTIPPMVLVNPPAQLTCAIPTQSITTTPFSPSAVYTYSWTAGTGGNIISAGNGSGISVNAPGVYSLVVSDPANGCTATYNATVTQEAGIPVVMAASPGPFTCVDTLQNLSSAGSSTGAEYIYSWSAGNGGNILSGNTTPNPLIDAVGAYFLQITNQNNGCTAFDTVIVTANTVAPPAVASPPGIITCAVPFVSLQANENLPLTNLAFQWSTTEGNFSNDPNNALTECDEIGTYYLVVTDILNGCTSTDSLEVTENRQTPALFVAPPFPLTCAITEVNLAATASGSTPLTPLFQWQTGNGYIVSGDSTATPLVDAPGNYALIVTDPANGCTITGGAIVFQNITPPPIQVLPANSITCATPEQILQGQNQAASGNFTYVWSASNGGQIISGDSTLMPTVNAPGMYLLTAVNLTNGCQAVDSVAVLQNTTLPLVDAASPGPFTCVDTLQNLSAAGSSTGAEYSYSWSAGNGGNILSGNTTPNPLIDAVGTYFLQITNQNNGCTASDTVIVIANTVAPPAVASPPGIITCAAPFVVLQANENLPLTNLTFQWTTTDGHFSNDPNNALTECDETGTYYLVVTDILNGCTSTDSLEIMENRQAPTLFVAPPFPLTCAITEVNLTVTASGSTPLTPLFQWQTGNGHIVSGDTTATPLVDTPGNYALTVTDPANGCTTTGGAIVSQNITPPPIQVLPAGLITCATPEQTLEGQNQAASGNFTYAWSASDGGQIISGDSTLLPIVNAAGMYLLTAVNLTNGCQAVDSVDVLQNTTLPLADAGLSDTLNCLNNSLTIQGTAAGQGALTYEWTSSVTGNITGGATTLSPTVDMPGAYILLVTDQLNGCKSADSVQVFQDANAPLADAGPTSTLTCQLTQTMLQGVGSTGSAYSYLWTTTAGNILGDPATLNPLVDAPGLYVLQVSNADNGCIRMDSVVIAENLDAPTLSISTPELLTCTALSVQINAQTPVPGGTFIWTTQDGNISTGSSSPNPIVNQPGTYIATATDPLNGCFSSDSIVVASNTQTPVITVNTPAVLTCILTQTAISGTIVQPANNFSVQWTTIGGTFVSGQNSATPQVSAAGTYQMNVLDQANGCTAFVSVVVDEDLNPPTAMAAANQQITCDSTVVALSAAGSSSGPDFTYLWSGQQIVSGQTTTAPTVSATGIYMLIVTNETNGCADSTTTTVTANTTPPVVAIAVPPALTCVRDSVLINAGTSSSGAAFQINWATATGHFIAGQNTLMPLIDQPGTYILTIENTINGCSSTQSIQVLQNIAAPGAAIAPVPELHCNRPEASLTGSSPAAQTGFAWTTTNGQIIAGASTAVSTIAAPGTYQLLVTDLVNGCTSSAQLTVGESPTPDFLPVIWQPDCHIRTGAVDFGPIDGGQAPFRYSINGGQSYQNVASFETLAPGIYELVVQDAYGCTAVEMREVEAPFFPSVTLTSLHQLELGDSVQLLPVLNLPQNNVASWEWLPATGLSCSDCPAPTATPLGASMYTLVITDLNGCTALAETQFRVNTNRVLYPPNIISPNGDGKNDFFNLFGKGVADIKWLRVYDRWGTHLYDAEHLPINDEMQGWNGVFRGQPVSPGVFVWQAMVEFIDGVSEIFSGDITVVR